MKKWELSLISGLLLAIFISTYGQFAIACSNICTDTLRLHILANSNSESDQAVKIFVRDEILREYGTRFSASKNKLSAKQNADELLLQITKTANEALAQKGLNYSAKAYIVNMKFGTTRYKDFTLPAGNYDAVRIELGRAVGKNWFCVLFPPLCLPASSDEVYQAYSTSENAVIREKYKIKFAIFELFAK